MAHPFQAILPAVILVLNFVTPSAAGPFEDGVAAYDHQHYVTAMHFWRPLADAGDAMAPVSVGVLFRDGKGVPLGNEITAYMWFSLSAAQGNTKAAQYRHDIAQRMTPSQVAEAQRLAQKSKAKPARQ